MSEEELEQAAETPPTPESGVSSGVASQVEGETVEVDSSLVGAVSANQNATVSNSIALAVMAGANASMENGASLAIMAGSNMELTNGGASFIAAGGNVEIHNGGAGFIVCQQATLEHTTINFLLANNVELGENTRVVFSTRQAAALGAGFGAVVFLLSLLFRKRRR